MTPFDRQCVLNNVLTTNWDWLCEYLRDWYYAHCPGYRRDEIEGAIGSWVGRMAIIKHQLDDGSKVLWRELAGQWMAGPNTQQDIEAGLLREIDNKWSQEHAIYLRRMETIAQHPAAEQHVDEVLARLKNRKVVKNGV